MREASTSGARKAPTFAAVYAEHAGGVYASAFRVLGRAADAEDVVQDVFLRFWQSPDRFDAARGPLGAFLRLMARSRALDVWRADHAAMRAKDRLELGAARDEVRLDERPGDAAELHEQRRTVQEALRRLPPEQREAVVLSYWGGLSGRELAERSGLAFGTARSRIRLGVEKLRGDAELANARQAA
jgi:RNA polymerase sigma-70 factor (ECF subfamily)